MTERIVLRPSALSLTQLRGLALGGPQSVEWAIDARRVEQSATAVAEILGTGRDVYGINTGFGRLARVRIADDRLVALQRNLVLSHATGTGPALPDAVVRLVLVLKIASLAQGFSGVRTVVLDALRALLEHDVLPVIPSKGSVGASGDLAPLAHLSTALLGVGQVRVGGLEISAAEGLAKCGLQPLELGPKEGLALLNGTQVSTALALHGLFAAENVFAAAMLAGAMSVDAAQGSVVPFDERIQAVRGQPGQIETAAVFRELLDGSDILDAHQDCEKVQDPYSLRCQPQVMGACLQQMRYVASVLATEANAVTDNPLVFSEEGEAISGGNFHAEPVALVADALAVVVAEIGNLSERRIALLTDSSLSGLPPFLVEEPGENSGFMIAHVTAAALASENKMLSHPASVDTIPTSANQEDHVSMATHGARRLGPMTANASTIVGVELLAAAQGVEFRRPLTSSDALEEVMNRIRAAVPKWDGDRYFAPDIEWATESVQKGDWLLPPIAKLLPSTSEAV